MAKGHRILLAAAWFLAAKPVLACEPVIPFMQATVPAIALSGSLLVLAVAVVVKSLLFAFFERRIPLLRAAWRMFVGNVVTSFVGLLVALMVASSPSSWIIGLPVVFGLCWLPARRLVKSAPLAWLTRTSPAALAGGMTCVFAISCILFMVGQGLLATRHHALYWVVKLAAIFLALLASVTLTTIWEEWVIWKLSSGPEGKGFFATALRANLYVLLLVMAVPAALILPKRLHSPDFLAHGHSMAAAHASALTR